MKDATPKGNFRRNLFGRVFVCGRPLPARDRTEIVQLSSYGIRASEISRRLGISSSCVSRIVKKHKETGSSEPGRPGGRQRPKTAKMGIRSNSTNGVQEMPSECRRTSHRPSASDTSSTNHSSPTRHKISDDTSAELQGNDTENCSMPVMENQLALNCSYPNPNTHQDSSTATSETTISKHRAPEEPHTTYRNIPERTGNDAPWTLVGAPWILVDDKWTLAESQDPAAGTSSLITTQQTEDIAAKWSQRNVMEDRCSLPHDEWIDEGHSLPIVDDPNSKSASQRASADIYGASIHSTFANSKAALSGTQRTLSGRQGTLPKSQDTLSDNQGALISNQGTLLNSSQIFANSQGELSSRREILPSRLGTSLSQRVLLLNQEPLTPTGDRGTPDVGLTPDQSVLVGEKHHQEVNQGYFGQGPESETKPVKSLETIGNKVAPSNGVISPSSDERDTKRRTDFTLKQVCALGESFNRNHFPTRQVKEQLARDLQLSYNTVHTWFANHRQRWMKVLKRRSVPNSSNSSPLDVFAEYTDSGGEVKIKRSWSAPSQVKSAESSTRMKPPTMDTQGVQTPWRHMPCSTYSTPTHNESHVECAALQHPYTPDVCLPIHQMQTSDAPQYASFTPTTKAHIAPHQEYQTQTSLLAGSFTPGCSDIYGISTDSYTPHVQLRGSPYSGLTEWPTTPYITPSTAQSQQSRVYPQPRKLCMENGIYKQQECESSRNMTRPGLRLGGSHMGEGYLQQGQELTAMIYPREVFTYNSNQQDLKSAQDGNW